MCGWLNAPKHYGTWRSDLRLQSHTINGLGILLMAQLWRRNPCLRMRHSSQVLVLAMAKDFTFFLWQTPHQNQHSKNKRTTPMSNVGTRLTTVTKSRPRREVKLMAKQLLWRLSGNLDDLRSLWPRTWTTTWNIFTLNTKMAPLWVRKRSQPWVWRPGWPGRSFTWKEWHQKCLAR